MSDAEYRHFLSKARAAMEGGEPAWAVQSTGEKVAVALALFTVEVLTKGGPNKATEVLLYTMYTEAFNFFRTGYGAAITVVFLVVVLALTLLQVKAGEKRTHYG